MRFTILTIRWSFCLLLIAAASTGCSLLTEPELGDPSQLPAVQISDETVVLEIAKVSISKADWEKLDEIWMQTDEQFLTLDSRRQLEQNGMRAGLVNYHLPEALRNIIEQGVSKPGLNGESSVLIQDGEVQVVSQQRFRKGKRTELISSEILDELTPLVREYGKLHGETYYDAQCKFAITASGQDDGRVLLELTPEIHHGESRQNYREHQGMIRIEHRKQRKVFDKLEIKTLLNSGQTIIIGTTPDIKGPGKAFFTDSKNSDSVRKLLLIRVAGSQYDNLFQAPKTVGENSAITPVTTDGLVPSNFD
ncbi:MAG: hypothetical protein COA78_22570 [Blastopirellula sp.]|nr:MAG: hypothetical protein COA78_22570 [Blastopirellula sp.]